MAVPNTTSSGVVSLPRHDALNRILLDCKGIFCTKSAEEPGMADQDQRNTQVIINPVPALMWGSMPPLPACRELRPSP